MSTVNFQLQYILRAYGRQLANRTRVSKGHKNHGEVTISTEGKKKLLFDRIVQEIMGQFAGGTQLSERCRDILEQLSQEYGRPLEISSHEGEEIAFKVFDEKTREVKFLSAYENERLERRLYDFAQSTVYNDLTEASININIPDQESVLKPPL